MGRSIGHLMRWSMIWMSVIDILYCCCFTFACHLKAFGLVMDISISPQLTPLSKEFITALSSEHPDDAEDRTGVITGFAALIRLYTDLLDLFQNHCPPRHFRGTFSRSSKAFCYSIRWLGNASILSGWIAWVVWQSLVHPEPLPNRLKMPAVRTYKRHFRPTLHAVHFTIPLSCRFNNPPWPKLHEIEFNDV